MPRFEQIPPKKSKQVADEAVSTFPETPPGRIYSGGGGPDVDELLEDIDMVLVHADRFNEEVRLRLARATGIDVD